MITNINRLKLENLHQHDIIVQTSTFKGLKGLLKLIKRDYTSFDSIVKVNGYPLHVLCHNGMIGYKRFSNSIPDYYYNVRAMMKDVKRMNYFE